MKVEWNQERPSEEGRYWFFGTWSAYMQPSSPSHYIHTENATLIQLEKMSTGKLFCRIGKFAFPVGNFSGHFASLQLPEPPEEI